MDATVSLTEETIALGNLLKVAGVVDSGGQGKHMILDGLVRVNGEVETRRGRKLRSGDLVEVDAVPTVRIHVQ